jgi:hypothetical protein
VKVLEQGAIVVDACARARRRGSMDRAYSL